MNLLFHKRLQVAGATHGLWLMTDSPSAMTASWKGNERKGEKGEEISGRQGTGGERRGEGRERRGNEGGGRREEMM